MKEIEIKIQITDQQHQILDAWLEEKAIHVGTKVHVEYYLDNPKMPNKFIHQLGYVDSEKYLRVRKTEKGDSVCLKHFEIDRETGESRNISEFESTVADGQQLLSLLERLGFNDRTLVEKERKSYKYDNFEIEIDKVSNLGVFVEVELKDHDDDLKKGIGEIYNFLRKIGIVEFEKQTRGYVSMLWNPGYNFAKKTVI